MRVRTPSELGALIRDYRMRQDFEDEKFGGYSVSDLDRLVRECRFLDLVERPALLTCQTPWIIQAGARPQPDGVVTSGGSVSG